VSPVGAASSGGEEYVADWLDANPGARMVVVDVFAKVRGIAPPIGAPGEVRAVRRLEQPRQMNDHIGSPQQLARADVGHGEVRLGT
jgi:hypothetical protein